MYGFCCSLWVHMQQSVVQLVNVLLGECVYICMSVYACVNVISNCYFLLAEIQPVALIFRLYFMPWYL